MGDGRMEHQLVIRVPQQLHDALAADARANGRTLAQSVRWHLRRALLDRTDDVVLDCHLCGHVAEAHHGPKGACTECDACPSMALYGHLGDVLATMQALPAHVREGGATIHQLEAPT